MCDCTFSPCSTRLVSGYFSDITAPRPSPELSGASELQHTKLSAGPHAVPDEMNKVPPPITGPPTAPHSAPSPGLSQATFPAGQPPSVVFGPPPPQMNTAPQPRQFAAGPRTLNQQQFFQARPGVPSSTPRPVAPTHVYQPGSQMMMIPQQQLPFPNSQGYFIPSGQYRSSFMPTAQQYPVSSGTPGFYSGSSPEYEPSLAVSERRGGGGRGSGRENSRHGLHGGPLGTQRFPGGYFTHPQQYAPAVPAASVIMASPQQPPPPVQQQQSSQPKRERKPIRIRDPNQGGRDITEEIMSGGKTTSTPTPSQSALPGAEEELPHQANGEVVSAAVLIKPDEQIKRLVSVLAAPTPPPSMTPEPTLPVPAVAESKTDTDNKGCVTPEVPVLPGDHPDPDNTMSVISSTPPTAPTPPPVISASDSVDSSAAVVSENAPETTEEVETPPASDEEKDVHEEAKEEVVMEEQDELDVATVELDVATVELDVATVELDVATVELDVATVELDVATVELDVATVEPEKTASSAPCVEPSDRSTTPTSCLVEEPALPARTSTPFLTLEPKPLRQPRLRQLTNGLTRPIDLDLEDVSDDSLDCSVSPTAEPEVAQLQEAPIHTGAATVSSDQTEEPEDATPEQTSAPTGEASLQAAVSVPKKIKDLNKKEAVGDLMDAFIEQVIETLTTPDEVLPALPQTNSTLPTDERDGNWEGKEDKLDTENIEPEVIKPGDLKYQYKEEQWKPINPEEKKMYDREFLLGFQFISASMHKPEGLPHISEVVLDKANKNPLRPLDPSRLVGMNCGPDFTPSFANLGRQPMNNRGPPSGMGRPRHSQQGQRREPRKILISMSLTEDVQLNKAEKAWKPGMKKLAAVAKEKEDLELGKTLELFSRVRGILNKLTPQMFQQLMKRVSELPINTEERLKGVIDLVFEKAISEPNFSVAYANMCRCLTGLKVPTTDKPSLTVNFLKVLLNRCQKEFEKDVDDDEIFERKQKELDAAAVEEEKQRLQVELVEAKNEARRRSLGNIKFIGELFKLKMLTEPIMHDCIVKLLKNHDDESLECLCRLLTTIGKDLDFEKAKPRMDQYFHQMEKIIKEKKTSSRIRFMLQDVVDLRLYNWVPRRADQGPKTIDQIHKEAELEEHQEQAKVQQQLLSKKDTRIGGGGGGGRGGPHAPAGRGGQQQDEGWSTVPISKNRPIDTSRLSKITKPGALDFNNQLLAPGGKGSWGSWGKGSSGGTGAKPSSEPAPESGRPATSTLNRFSALQPGSTATSSSSADGDRRLPQRSSLSRDRGERSDRFDRPERQERGTDRYERRDERGPERSDRNRPPVTKRSYSRERDQRDPDPVRRVATMTNECEWAGRDRGRHNQGSRDRGSRDRASYDRGSRDRASYDRGSRDRASYDRASYDRGSRDRASYDRGSRDRASYDRGSRDRASYDRASLDRGSRDRASLDRGSRDRASRDRASQDRASQDRASQDRASQDRAKSKETVSLEAVPNPPLAPCKPVLSEDEMEKKSTAIIEEYLHINDLKEAVQCVQEMNCASLLYIFVRSGVESTLERSTIAREHMGLLLHQLVKAGALPTEQYYKGLQEILEVAEDMAIDIPHIWLYMAEIITPMVQNGGIAMAPLVREVSKPLIPLGQAAVLLVEILSLLCKGMGHKKAGTLWREAGLDWKDFLSKDEDVNKFVTEKNMAFTLGEDSETTSKKELSPEELCRHLEKLIQEKANNQRIYDWVEANLDEQQSSSNVLVRGMMTSVCQSAIVGEVPCRVDPEKITQRAKLLQKYLTDEQKELQALYALQALMVKLEQPANLLRMFFDTLYDEDVIKEEAFYKWESSKDPAEQQGKGVALKSVTAFFTWLREAEEESDNS